jgi:hypothetical protein
MRALQQIGVPAFADHQPFCRINLAIVLILRRDSGLSARFPRRIDVRSRVGWASRGHQTSPAMRGGRAMPTGSVPVGKIASLDF